MSVVDIDVIVIGAGLAGLVAARSCVEAGLTTSVVEANDRVGGRVRSQIVGGRRLDLGAEWIVPHLHHAVMAEMARYGIEPESAPQPEPACWAFDETVRTEPVLDAAERAEFEALCAAIDRDAARVDVDDPMWHVAVDDLDVTMTDYLDRFEVTRKVRSWFLAQAFALVGGDERRYSAMHLLHEIAGFGSCSEAFEGEASRVDGGSASIAAAISHDLEPGTISLDTPVRGVRLDEHGSVVEVTTARGTLRARAAIVTVPVNVLRTLELAVPLSDLARSIVTTGHLGSIAKVWSRLDDVPQPYRSVGWPDVPEAYGVHTDAGHLVAAFQLVRGPDSEEATAEARAELRRRHPDADLPEDPILHDWVADASARGTWCAPAVGQHRALYALASQPGPCFFAGSDVSRRWGGWMDGAITSGSDAAERAVRFLFDGTELPVRG